MYLPFNGFIDSTGFSLMTSFVCVESKRAKGSGLGTHHLRDAVSKGSKIPDGMFRDTLFGIHRPVTNYFTSFDSFLL
jgi:hypothetical protein